MPRPQIPTHLIRARAPGARGAGVGAAGRRPRAGGAHRLHALRVARTRTDEGAVRGD